MVTTHVNRWSAVVAGMALLSGSAPTRASAPSEPPTLEGTIIFDRYGGEFGNESIFIANADGTDERPLVDHETCCPWVSRDGSRVAILADAADSPDGRATVEIVNVDGWEPRVLQPPGETLSIFPGPFTPDGSQIAYNAFDETDPSRNGIYLGSSSDPSDAVQIISSEQPAEPHGATIAVSFNPDGTELLLYVQAPGDDSNTHGFLALGSVDGGDVRRLTPEGIDLPCCAFWSPDGEQIVFTELDGRLLLIDPETAELTEVLVPDGSWARSPNWSPDGSQIMFTLDTNPAPITPAPNEIYVINADGTGLTPVVVTPDHKNAIWWVPTVTAADASN